MKKRILFLLICCFFLFPITVRAITKDYEDVVYKITDAEIEENKINVYIFHGAECPHCNEEIKWLNEVKETYKDEVNFIYYEVWHDSKNHKLMETVKESLHVETNSVPFTIVGDKTFFGFSDAIKNSIENQINVYLERETSDKVTLPFLKEVSVKEVSLPLVAVVLGLVDGFNPCAMWILLFLINMLIGMKDRKRMWMIGFSFLFASGLIYFLSMLGISYALDILAISFLKKTIAIVAIILGIGNIRNYIKTKDSGCHVVDEKKRKKIIQKIKQFTQEKSLVFALIGSFLLGVSVNMIELACSLGFPVLFTEMLTINNVHGIIRICYLLLYLLFYMIDDLIVFVLAMISLSVTGISTKYNRLSHLVGGILMILMGLLLFFKPEWLMFNF